MDERRVVAGLERLIKILLAEGVRGFIIISEAQLQQLLGMIEALGPELDALVRDTLAPLAEGPDGAKGSLFVSEARWTELLEIAQQRLHGNPDSLDEELVERLVVWIEAVHASTEGRMNSMSGTMVDIRDALGSPTTAVSSPW